MRKVLIAGASGYLGHFPVKEAKRRGYWVRAITRSADRLDDLAEFIDDLFVGEVTRAASLNGICEDIDIAISAVGITKQKDGLSYKDVDYQANQNLLEEAMRCGCSKFIYVSVFGAERLHSLKMVRAKFRFESSLRESGISYSIVRPNGFFSDMLEYLKMAKNGKGYLFGSGDQKINPIHGEDVAQACLNAIESNDRMIDVGGPDVFSYHEIMNMAFDIFGKSAKVTRIPCWAGKLTISLMRKITPVRLYGPLEFFISVLTTDMVAPVYGNHHLREYFVENFRADTKTS